MEQEKRQRPRAGIQWPVIVRSSQGIMQGMLHNASSTGVFISCPKPLKPHEVFELVIEVPVSNRRLRATAEVAWSSTDDQDNEACPHGMAVRFIKIAGADRKVIADAVINHLQLSGVEPDEDTIEIAIDPLI